MQTFSDITFDFSPEAYDCAILPPDAVVKPTGSPPTAPTTTGASSSEPKSCNFEEDFCNWNVDFGLNDTEAFVFKRSKGELQDGEHGPSWDHDRSKTSYFLWADAASGNPDTLTAISSPQFSTTKPFCFTFWFDLTVRNHLRIKKGLIKLSLQHGDGIRTLKVEIQSGSYMPATIWEFQSKLDFWEYGEVELGANDGFKVTFPGSFYN